MPSLPPPLASLFQIDTSLVTGAPRQYWRGPSSSQFSLVFVSLVKGGSGSELMLGSMLVGVSVIGSNLSSGSRWWFVSVQIWGLTVLSDLICSLSIVVHRVHWFQFVSSSLFIQLVVKLCSCVGWCCLVFFGVQLCA